MTKKITDFIIPLILPLLIANYPAILHYADNVGILQIDSLGRVMYVLNTPIALVTYSIYFFTSGKRSYNAAIATFIFLIFYNIYGYLFNYLISINLIKIEHFNFSPLFLVIAIYTSKTIFRISHDTANKLWLIFTTIALLLVSYNVIRFLPKEIAKSTQEEAVEVEEVNQLSNYNSYPDIYYLVFDEFSSFDAMRNYWQYDEIEEFVDFLKTKGFYVAESSSASSIDTLHQMASRLNYKDYPLGADYVDTYYRDIANNQVMSYLKNFGYTTIVFDETRVSFAYPAKGPIKADVNYENDPSIDSKNEGFLFDEYGTMVADKTMLLIFSKYYKIYNPELQKHKDMIYFTENTLGKIRGETPIFVYTHLMLPHMPFMFDKVGRFVDPTFHQNWNYYLGNYQFAVGIAEKMVNNILLQYDSSALPIIILQSDHGARNKPTSNPGSKILENYPEEYKTLIMNAFYVPNCENAPLSQNMDPINTFPIIFNCVFGDIIPLQ